MGAAVAQIPGLHGQVASWLILRVGWSRGQRNPSFWRVDGGRRRGRGIRFLWGAVGRFKAGPDPAVPDMGVDVSAPPLV